MIGYIIFAFLLGGLFGMVGMAIFAYGPRMTLIQENYILKERVEFLEKETEKKYQTVKDPRMKVHNLVN
jgi:hypothetical protein